MNCPIEYHDGFEDAMECRARAFFDPPRHVDTDSEIVKQLYGNRVVPISKKQKGGISLLQSNAISSARIGDIMCDNLDSDSNDEEEDSDDGDEEETLRDRAFHEAASYIVDHFDEVKSFCKNQNHPLSAIREMVDCKALRRIANSKGDARSQVPAITAVLSPMSVDELRIFRFALRLHSRLMLATAGGRDVDSFMEVPSRLRQEIIKLEKKLGNLNN